MNNFIPGFGVRGMYPPINDTGSEFERSGGQPIPGVPIPPAYKAPKDLGAPSVCDGKESKDE